MKYTTEDWARMTIAKQLGVNIKGKRKLQQWHDIVRTLVTTLDHYHAMMAQLEAF